MQNIEIIFIMQIQKKKVAKQLTKVEFREKAQKSVFTVLILLDHFYFIFWAKRLT